MRYLVGVCVVVDVDLNVDTVGVVVVVVVVVVYHGVFVACFYVMLAFLMLGLCL